MIPGNPYSLGASEKILCNFFLNTLFHEAYNIFSINNMKYNSEWIGVLYDRIFLKLYWGPYAGTGAGA
jgi:hypothetical protein